MPTELFAHVEKTLRELSRKVDLMLITKGDLHEQHGRFERSGLQEHFRHVEVVAAKTPAIYRKLLDRHGIAPREFVMVGNAMKSDILPVLAIGGRAVYIHCADTWAHEHEAPPADAGERYYEVAHIGLLPALLAEMAGGPT
jgi:putative hydrolase of the HAD superfamily